MASNNSWQRPESFYLSENCFNAVRDLFEDKQHYLDYETCRWTDYGRERDRNYTNLMFLREFKKNIQKERELIQILNN